jgi:hypothetical protein
MKKISVFFCFILIVFSGNAQLQIAQGTNWNGSIGTYVVLDSIGLQHDAASASLDNIFKFTGNVNTSISGATLPLFTNVEVGLTGTSKIILQRAINVSGSISFQSGLLDLNNNNIDLGTSGSIIGESETTRIIGPNGGFIQIVNTLNAPSSANPGNLGAILTSTQNLSSTIIRRGHQSQTNAGGAGTSVFRYYDISPSNNTALNATLRFSYFDAELNSLDENGLVFWRSTNNTSWTNQGFTSRNTTTNYVEKTGVGALSRWTLSSINNPLPVQFVLFNARCENGNVTLTWKTAQEFNSSYFNIERSTDGNHWIVIGTKPAAGNSNVESSYFYSDNVIQSNSVYRIAEYDINGDVKYTSIIRSDCNSKDDWKVWPNPTAENFWLAIKTPAESKITIKIFDSKGALVSMRQSNLLPGNNLLSIDMKKMAAGTYQIQANWNDGQMQKAVKIVKL